MKRMLLLSLVLCLVLVSPVVAQDTKIYPSRTTLPFLNISGGNITFLDANRCISWNSGDVTLCNDAANALTLAGGQFFLPNGTAAAPALSFTNDADAGWYYTGGNWALGIAGTPMWNFTYQETRINGSYPFGFSSGDPTGSALDLIFSRENAAILQMGADSATPIAQTLKGADGLGANIVGGDFTSAPGRGTGTGAGGSYYIATAPAGAAGSGANALVNRVAVLPTGVTAFSPQDVAATPVEPTATLKLFAYNKSVADHGIITLPAVTTNGRGWITVGTAGTTYASFIVDSTGTVTLLTEKSGDVVANANTDAKLDIGTAATQEPLQIANELGATHVINIIFLYD